MRKPAIKSKPAPARAPVPETVQPRIPVWLLAVLLMLVTTALYWPATRCDFINFDDTEYVTANPHVQGGLNWESVRWAFFNPVSANWHPLTVMSHMLDCQLFGLNPWGHHLINVLFHALNAALVFVLLRLLTGATWRSLLVAALFAFHPLRVESVAWVSERKDVLSGFLGLLALIFYARYAGKRLMDATGEPKVGMVPALDHRPATLDYMLALFFLALGLMSKPMLVTWPFVMLLLDYWPLKRFQIRSAWRLVMEKIPFFVLAAVASYVTFVVQKIGGSLMASEAMPPGARVGNALVSYCRYLGKMIWPTDLAVFYPHPGYWPLSKVMLAGLLLVVISVLLFVKRRRYPFLLIGWLWFCGMLVPMIGLVQTGGQALADRHTYIPSLGLLILAIWGANEMTRHWRHRLMVLSAAGSAAIVLCFALTRQQLGYWRDSETLFRHALAVTENNYRAYSGLGDALDKKGQTDEAISQYQEAIRLAPGFAEAHYNLGVALDKRDQTDEAIRQYQEAIRLKPDYAEAQNNLGFALAAKGRFDEAIENYHKAIQINPNSFEALNNLGLALAAKGRFDEAIENYHKAIQINPNFSGALNDLGVALAAKGRFDEAIENCRKAVQINPNSFKALNNLGVALAAKGRFDEAVENYRKALQIKPNDCDALDNLGVALAAKGRFDEAIENYYKAIQINSNRPETFLHLGMTLGQLGRIREAVAQYREALRLNPNLAGALNNLAWVLAASPDDQLRNGAEAVRLAERACELTHYGQPLFIGTLAAAYAECGRFPEAVTTAEKAEKLATDAGLKKLAEKNRQLLELYRAGKPYHEPVPSGH